MKVNRLETHDRLLEFGKQSDFIDQGCQDCIKNRPAEFEHYPFYIFAHKRTYAIDERCEIYNNDLMRSILDPCHIRTYSHFNNVPTAKIIWMPRLTKPKCEPNSMLFKHYPQEGIIKVFWLLPEVELWDQYTHGNMCDSRAISESINMYKTNKSFLEKPEDDDLPDYIIEAIQIQIGLNKKRRDSLQSTFIKI